MMQHWLSGLLLGLTLLASAQARGVEEMPFDVIPARDYANFVRNWDDKTTPVLCALIEDSEQYDEIFSPAAVMGNKRAYKPEEMLFITHNLLVVARVLPATTGEGRAMSVGRVSLNGDTLELHYRYVPPPAGLYHFKESLTVSVPKVGYRKVRFIENGQMTAEKTVRSPKWH